MISGLLVELATPLCVFLLLFLNIGLPLFFVLLLLACKLGGMLVLLLLEFLTVSVLLLLEFPRRFVVLLLEFLGCSLLLLLHLLEMLSGSLGLVFISFFNFFGVSLHQILLFCCVFLLGASQGVSEV